MRALTLQPVVKHTYSDYAAIPPDRARWELIEGEFYVSPAPSTFHQSLSGRLFFELTLALGKPGLAQVFAAPFDVILSPHDTVQPDLVVVRRARAQLITARALEGAPDLAIEILSPTSRVQDRKVKRELYARFGVREYWLVDPDEKTVELLVLGAQTYDRHAVLGERDTLLSAEFPQVQIELAELFAPVV